MGWGSRTGYDSRKFLRESRRDTSSSHSDVPGLTKVRDFGLRPVPRPLERSPLTTFRPQAFGVRKRSDVFDDDPHPVTPRPCLAQYRRTTEGVWSEGPDPGVLLRRPPDTPRRVVPRLRAGRRQCTETGVGASSHASPLSVECPIPEDYLGGRPGGEASRSSLYLSGKDDKRNIDD